MKNHLPRGILLRYEEKTQVKKTFRGEGIYKWRVYRQARNTPKESGRGARVTRYHLTVPSFDVSICARSLSPEKKKPLALSRRKFWASGSRRLRP